jgi:hypothetical protein
MGRRLTRPRRREGPDGSARAHGRTEPEKLFRTLDFVLDVGRQYHEA